MCSCLIPRHVRRYAGMMEAIRIRQQGYAVREKHATFFKMYSMLVPGCNSINILVEELSKRLSVDKKEWQVGQSKIFMRRTLSDKLHRLLLVRARLSARVIQSGWTKYRRRKAALKVQTAWRMARAQRAYQRQKRMSVTLQSWYRGQRQKAKFVVMRKSAIQVQKIARGASARKRFKKLRNPFKRIPKAELKKIVRATKLALLEAQQSKAFAKCAELAGQLELQEIALKDAASESACPFTREELDKELVRLQEAMATAMKSKQFDVCETMQKEVDNLEAWKTGMPTLAEVAQQIESKQASLAEQTKSKMFKACAELQLDLEELENLKTEIELQIALIPKPEEAKPVPREFASRAELESKIAEVHQKLTDVSPPLSLFLSVRIRKM
jgi:myosin heavy subunit